MRSKQTSAESLEFEVLADFKKILKDFSGSNDSLEQPSLLESRTSQTPRRSSFFLGIKKKLFGSTKDGDNKEKTSNEEQFENRSPRPSFVSKKDLLEPSSVGLQKPFIVAMNGSSKKLNPCNVVHMDAPVIPTKSKMLVVRMSKVFSHRMENNYPAILMEQFPIWKNILTAERIPFFIPGAMAGERANYIKCLVDARKMRSVLQMNPPMLILKVVDPKFTDPCVEFDDGLHKAPIVFNLCCLRALDNLLINCEDVKHFYSNEENCI